MFGAFKDIRARLTVFGHFLEMSANYLAGNYGYGHTKQALYELILDKFEEPREKFEYCMNHKNEVDEALAFGAEKARKVADEVLARVREKFGY